MNNKSLKSFLDEGTALLDTYKGRDKALRTLCYVTKLISETQKDPDTSKKWSTFGSQMSATRTTLRLLDDMSVIKNTLEFGLGKNEPDKVLAFLGVWTNLIDQVFLVTEKISWLAKYKIINAVNKSKWDNISTFCWVLTSYLTILKTLRYLVALQKHRKHAEISKIEEMRKFQLLTLVRLCLDFTHAVGSLPSGFLWSSMLKDWHVALVGTASSILGIYLIFYKKWWLK